LVELAHGSRRRAGRSPIFRVLQNRPLEHRELAADVVDDALAQLQPGDVVGRQRRVVTVGGIAGQRRGEAELHRLPVETLAQLKDFSLPIGIDESPPHNPTPS
jgi:hypothetical protein